MKSKIVFFVCISFLFSCTKEIKKENLLTKGISFELAKYRKKQISDVIYSLRFDIPNEKEKAISAQLKINLIVNDLTENLYLDFNEETAHLKNIEVNQKKVEVQHLKEHIILEKNTLKIGENTIEISFDAGEMSLNRNDDFLYTLLVPDRASTLFPCFDQPDIKANYNLYITAPKDWKVVCGSFEDKQIEKGEFTEHRFKQTDKMSTYLFSFVAGKFTEVKRKSNTFDMRFLYRETDKEKIAESVDKIFSIHQKSINFLEVYTAQKFPFQKMDFASIPPFQYGGMEHVGAIQYRESALFLSKNVEQQQELDRAKLISHETAHMWFGNLVTMRWFNDVWMKEVFANFMADKIMNPVFPEINHSLNFMMSHYPAAYSEDRTEGTNAIRQSLGNLKNAGSLYGRIIYDKAPIMMRQLEHLIGKESFKKGIQEYIKTYADDNADWNELVAIFDKKSPKNITKWSEVWVNSSGRPIISDSIEYENGKISLFEIHQKAEDNSNKIWAQFFQIGLVYDDEIKLIDVQLSDKKTALKKVIGLPKPNHIIYNSNGFGYGVFPIDKEKINHYKTLTNEVNRGHAFINLYENMLTGNISPLLAYHVFLDALKEEKNELIAGYISERIRMIFWKFLTKKQQDKVQAKTAKNIYHLLEKELPSNTKKTLFNLYKSIAIDNQGKENLYAIWSKNKQIKNLFLNENDYISLASKLTIFKHIKAVEILKKQEQRITNSDRLARFRWLLPSLSNDAEIRKDFMNSLLQKENREKESWVQDGLSNIHHPLRQKESLQFVKPCLDILEEIQLTGDIFFPKRWLENSISNYSSKEANEILSFFLAKHPNYNPILKTKLLQVTNNLTRAQAIKK